MNKKQSLFVAKKIFASLVYNLLSLHENNKTSLVDIDNIVKHHNALPESRLEYLFQAKRMVDCWQRVIDDVALGQFALSAEKAKEYNGIIAKDESLLWGEFRTGKVSIGGTKEWKCPPAEILEAVFLEIVEDVKSAAAKGESEIFRAGVFLYAQLCDRQFFFDGNKRTAFCMLNGFLMSNGFLPIMLPLEQKSVYDRLMLNYYEDKSSANFEEIVVFFERRYLEMQERFSFAETK